MQPLPLPCYCGSLRQAARVLTQIYDEHLKAADLRITQYTLLETISRLPGIRIAELASALAMDDTTVTHSIKVMKTAGWVLTETPSNDRRERTLTLSATGHRRLALARPLWESAQAAVEARLPRTTIEVSQKAALEVASAFS